ncbi:MAG: oligosaccharide flippase family protein [Oligoflexia bacterium]|nr:oligosaccharide flippase family protein [Oligoflexia bacterium]
MKLSLIGKNFTALVSSNFLIQFVRFLTIALLARRLGSQAFGVYSYIVLIITYGFVLVEFGLKNVALRELAQGRGSKKFVKQILKVRLALACVGFIGVIGLCSMAFSNGIYFLPTVVLALSLFVDAFLLDFVVIAQEKLVVQAIGNVAQALFLYLGCLLFVHSEGDFLILSWLYLLSHVIWISIFLIAGKPFSLLPENRGDNVSLYHTAMLGVPFLLAQMLGTIQFSMDLFLLGQFHYENWLGDYSAAIKILALSLGVINALVAAIQPRIAREVHDLKSPGLQNLVHSTTRMIWLMLLPTLAGCWLFGDTLIYWFFGDKFLLAPTLLKPLSLAFTLFCLGLAPMHALFMSHDTRLLIKTMTINSLISFLVITAILALGHPELVPWGMVITQGIYMIGAWKSVGMWGFISYEEIKTFLFPFLLMITPLLMQSAWVSPVQKITLAAFGYILGLFAMRIWTRPWFIAILGRT